VIAYPRTWVEIDLPALTHNLRLIRESIADPSVILTLVAKADAYGHGMVQIVRHALQEGAQWCAVATVQEGIALRDAGIDAPILILSPILSIEAEQAVFYDFRLLIEREEIAESLNQAAKAQKKRMIVHIKVDTGVARYGCEPKDVLVLAKKIQNMSHLYLEGIATHFVDSAKDPKRTGQQIQIFESVLEECHKEGISWDIIHMANSAGAMFYPESRKNLIRIGAAVYGLDAINKCDSRVKPILHWKTRIMSLREKPEGTTVSYSSTYVTKRPTLIATLGAGYGDGYPRALSNKGIVSIHSQEVPVIGMVCMDQLLVDVTDVPNVQIGDEAELIGQFIRADRLAEILKTTPLEITTRVMSRVARKYIYV